MLVELDDAKIRESQRGHLADYAAHLLAIAKDFGFVVTVEQRPLEPLAMGNHETIFSIRDDLAHVKAAMQKQ